jgi:mono/diheme cytochrome c family protein
VSRLSAIGFRLSVALLLGGLACHKSAANAGDALASGAAPPALALSKVEWNSTDGGVGQVQAVAELEEQLYLFGDSGAQVFAGGTPLSSDTSVTSWKGAGVIPAADGNGTWPVGIDAQGKLWRVHATGALEPISARYGLDRDAVLDLAALGNGYTAFALGASMAISDGTTVTRYDAPVSALGGGQGRVAWLEGDLARRLDPAHGTVESWHLPGARLLAMNDDGRIAAATDRQLFYESGTLDLNLLYTAAPGATISSLTSAAGRFWFVVGGRLGAIDRGNLERTADAPLAGAGADVRMYGSPSGDVWAVASGSLLRWASAGAGDFAAWQQTVLPVFARVCSSCHLPSGTAGVDLASYERWKEKRALIYQRVVLQKPSPMPPQGSGVTLTDADLKAIQAWASSGG